jgi:uncharacterized protein YaaQ
MQLLIAIVQDEDAGTLSRRLNEAGFRHTHISSTGGFLARGNVTILAGVHDEEVNALVNVVRTTCRSRAAFINAFPYAPNLVATGTPAAVMPLEVSVGGATIFSLPVRRFLRLHGGPTPAVADEQHAPDLLPTPPGANATGQLILAIVQNGDAAGVIKGLTEAGYRFTRIDTTGGFLRRGNTTLVIGVDLARVNAALDVIQSNCTFQAEPKPAEAGLPMYSATVFVLDALSHGP